MMILADKIIEERKKLGFSQEELAEKLSVSRQAVSKWESAQSVPDLQRIVQMSELFAVSTDYLLKDELEPERKTADEPASDRTMHRVSMEEANEYLSVMREQSKIVAFAVLLCILCPVMLIFLAGLAEAGVAGLTESAAAAVGLAVLFLFVAAAVYLLIGFAGKTEKFEILEKEAFETAYGVTGLVKEKKAAYQPIYIRGLSVGVILCVLSPLPLILASIIKEDGLRISSMVALLLCLVAIGVYLIVRVAMVQDSYQMLLQEGEYDKAEKQKSKAAAAVNSGYWCVVTAAFLAWSFITGDWKSTWIVWPIAGVLFAPFTMIVKQLCGNKNT